MGWDGVTGIGDGWCWLVALGRRGEDAGGERGVSRVRSRFGC